MDVSTLLTVTMVLWIYIYLSIQTSRVFLIIFTMKYGNMKKDAARKKFDALKAFKAARKGGSRAEVLF